MDVLLGWNATSFGGLSQTIMDPSLIWTPSLYFYARAGGADDTWITPTWPFVYGGGGRHAGARVYWSSPLRAELQCAPERASDPRGATRASWRGGDDADGRTGGQTTPHREQQRFALVPFGRL